MPAKTHSRPSALPPGPTAPAEALGAGSRAAALALLEAGLARRGGFDEALQRSPFTELAARERAFARALASTALRRLGEVDRRLDARLQREPPPAVRNLLRLGAVQLLHMDTAAHAAVSATVDQAGMRGDTAPFRGLVNAVLRGLGREAADAPPAPVEVNAPPWLYARWRAAYGEAAAQAIAARIAEEPPTDLTPRDPADVSALAALLEADILPGDGLRTRRRGEVADWPGFAEGRWWVQDASAAVAARVLDPRPGERVLDLCAAPGGKTLQLAAAGAEVTALDRSPARMRRVAENLARTGLRAEVVAAEAQAWADPRSFDAVLLDAPCASTGTFRRHPDVLWASRPGDVAKLAGVQARLLEAAAVRVRPGGRLVYCVCSLEPEEGEAQAEAFLARQEGAFEPLALRPAHAGVPDAAATAAGALRLHPGMDDLAGGRDGFFVAGFRRAR